MENKKITIVFIVLVLGIIGSASYIGLLIWQRDPEASLRNRISSLLGKYEMGGDGNAQNDIKLEILKLEYDARINLVAGEGYESYKQISAAITADFNADILWTTVEGCGVYGKMLFDKEGCTNEVLSLLRVQGLKEQTKTLVRNTPILCINENIMGECNPYQFTAPEEGFADADADAIKLPKCKDFTLVEFLKVKGNRVVVQRIESFQDVSESKKKDLSKCIASNSYAKDSCSKDVLAYTLMHCHYQQKALLLEECKTNSLSECFEKQNSASSLRAEL